MKLKTSIVIIFLVMAMSSINMKPACSANPAKSHTIQNKDCEKCETGYEWWPCNEPDLCFCTLEDPIEEDGEGEDDNSSTTVARTTKIEATTGSTVKPTTKGRYTCPPRKTDNTNAPPTTPTTPPPTSPPTPPPTGNDRIPWLTPELWDKFFPHRNDGVCHSLGIATLENFKKAVSMENGFLNGTEAENRLELAAFLAQTSQETTGGTPGKADYAEWGYCFMEEVGAQNSTHYCSQDYAACLAAGYPCECVPGQYYYGRGPMQLSWNYNYSQASKYLYGDHNVLLSNPNLIIDEGYSAFRAAIWFWMTEQGIKPSCHDVILDIWVPTQNDINKKRLPGFGTTTNIINGGIECMWRSDRMLNRIVHYKRYLSELGAIDNRGEDSFTCEESQSFNGG